jgi:hypothetical protein
LGHRLLVESLPHTFRSRLEHFFQQAGVESAWCHGIHVYACAPDLFRQCFTEPHEGGF